MRAHLANILALLLPFVSCFAWQKDSIQTACPDSVRFARLDSALLGYTASIRFTDTDTKSSECDFLINSASDTLMSRHIALWLFDFYRNSSLMGDEAVAIHVFNSCFGNGRFGMRSEFDKMDAEIFVDFNSSTLLGMKAPSVSLYNPSGRLVELPRDGGVSVLFFFDTSCSKCVLESKILPQVLQTVRFPMTFYAVYCGTDEKSWKDFRRAFRYRNSCVETVHLWDPEMKTQYLRLYGVISTPRIYVTDADGEVIGRRLEVDSLQEILNILNESYAQEKENKRAFRS